jgi:pyrimidine-nucleoside phosphorylase
MNIIDIITKKKNKEELTTEEINYVINGYINNNIKDYQMSSLLMAIVLNGMNDREIFDLTDSMVKSGDKLDLSNLDNVVDKHSTGGVGDKTTLIVGPIVASCGGNVAKMSGPGLGHTGGTIDKLESIPGFNSNLTEEEFINTIKEVGFSDIRPNNNMVPADKKIYALRDATGTVESIPLIASSIMSKKIAAGSKNLVIDIKVGKGALIKNISEAKKIANLMIEIGKHNNIKVICLLTNMDIPLGNNIGNSLEVEEVIDVLNNKKSGPLTDLCIELSTNMISLALNLSYEESKRKVLENLYNGKAYQKFLEFVNKQGGDISNLPKSRYICEVTSAKEGYLTDIDALKLGIASMKLGAGRAFKDDKIDYSAGLVLNKKINDYVKVGDILITVHTNKEVKDIDFNAFTISSKPRENIKVIYEVIK